MALKERGSNCGPRSWHVAFSLFWAYRRGQNYAVSRMGARQLHGGPSRSGAVP